MDDRRVRIAAALRGVREKLEAGRAAETERNLLRSRVNELNARIAALKNATYWAELDSGKSVAAGTKARYFGREYVCIKAHTKSLLRPPSDNEYWEVVEDDDGNG